MVASYSVTDSVSTWAATGLTSEADATTYAAARFWADWAAATADERNAAIMEASDWLKATYAPPVEYDATDDGIIQGAVAHAARLALTAPIMGGASAATPQVIRKKVLDVVDTTYAEMSAGSQRAERLSLVEAILRTSGVTYRSGGANNVRLIRA